MYKLLIITTIAVISFSSLGCGGSSNPTTSTSTTTSETGTDSSEEG